jgi:hypothetical protein
MNSIVLPAALLSWADFSTNLHLGLSGSLSILSRSRHGFSRSATDSGVREKRQAVLFWNRLSSLSCEETAAGRAFGLWPPRRRDGHHLAKVALPA